MAQIKVNVEGKSIEDLLKDGNRAYGAKHYANAIAYLSRCAEMAVFKHGEQHESLGPIYFSYGRALLELSREDADPLGEAVPKDVALEAIEEDIGDEEAEEEEEEGEEEEEDDEGGDTAEGEGDKKQDEPEEAKSNEEVKEVEGSSKGVEFNGEANTSQNENIEDQNKEKDDSSNEKPEPGSSEEKTEAKDDEPTDLQVAWEVLELAKIIFKNKGDAGKEQLANTLILLGEVSLESENFESAVNDIKEGLEIQKSIYEKENRKLAETYYKLGMALSTNNQIDEAIDNFHKTIEHLNYRIAKLEVTDDQNVDKDEINEMKQLIPEVEEKIADMKLCKEEKAKPDVIESEPAIQPSPEKKATDISHLVKRKRNLNESIEGCSSPAKKPATES